MTQKGAASLIPVLIIITGLVLGVYFINDKTGFISRALDVIGPSKSATLKIPIRSPKPSLIATGSAIPATASAKPATASASPKATATASASVKPSASATASASPR